MLKAFQSFSRISSAAFLLASAVPLAAQTTEMRFQSHGYSFNTLTGGMGAFTPRASIPFSLTYPDGTRTGTIEMTYPDVLSGEIQAGYLVLSSPVTVGFKLEFDHVASAVTPPQQISSRLNLEISSEHTTGENSPCKLTGSSETYQSGTTKHFSRTFVCTFSRVRASGDATFNNYVELRTISNACGTFPCAFDIFVGTTYRTVPPVDLTVSRIEVVQVVQDPENTVHLVAGKSTVARVFLGISATGGVVQPPHVNAVLRGFGAGVELAGSPILQAANAPIRAPNRPNREATNDSLNFKLPPAWTAAGLVTLRAEVNPNGEVSESDRTNNVLDTAVTFEDRERFDVRYFSVCHPDNRRCPSNLVAGYEAKMRKTFPIADDRLSYTRLRAPQWVWRRSLLNATDENDLIAHLRLRYELVNDGSIDQLVAWLPNLIGSSANAGLSDPLWEPPGEGRVSFVQDTSPLDRGAPLGEGYTGHTLAHEIGHNLGLRHTNTADCNRCTDKNTDWPYPNGRIQEVGFDPQTMKAVPASRFDVMTYVVPGTIIWISPFHFQKLFRGHFQPQSAARIQAPAASPYAIVSGSARHDGTVGNLDPVIVIDSSVLPDPSVAGGNHCIRFSGSAGTLSDYCFELSFESHPGRQELEQQHFALRIPYPAGVTRISLRHGDTELAVRTASASAPTLTITSPQAGDTWDGTRTIRWTGADADGDPISYTVIYSGDGGTTWLPIEVNTTATDFTFDTAEITSGNAVLFRVIASDGFRTAEASVGPLTVVAAPIIEVQQQADFGAVTLGTSADATLLLTNRGQKALTVSAITSSQGEFAIRTSAPVVVPPGGSSTIAVRFTPASEGVRTATVSFASDDPARPTVSASMLGAGLGAPRLAATPASVDFGSVAVGASRELAVTIRNTGRGSLAVLALGSSNSQFVVTSPAGPLTLPEGGQVQATVSFRPANAGPSAGTLTVAGSDSVSPLVTVSLTGTGTGSGTNCVISVSPANASLAVAGGSQTLTVSAPAGCSWTAASGAGWVTIGPAASGTGDGTISFSAGPNSGAARSSLLTVGAVATVVVAQSGGVESAVVPAVASTAGALGSFFKTGVQLHNPTNAPISGELTYHPAGASAESEDPSLFYEIGPRATVYFPDVLPAMQQSGLGSLDVIPRTGGFPVSTIRIFNDAGDAGTTGMTEELFRPDEALEQGRTGVLIAPPEPARARFNVGVRSLLYGATIRFTVRDANGTVRTTGTKVYPPAYFEQQSAEAFLGTALLANDTVAFEVTAGSAILYGATTDNTTQDPSLQFARPLRSGADPRRTIAAVASAPGVNDSLFRTTLQIHNPDSTPISGRLLFHPAGTSGSDSDPSIPYSLPPGATSAYGDVLTPFNRSGLGSLDLVAESGRVPLAVARVFNDGGASGTTGFSVDAIRPEDALQAGQTGILITPPDPATTRFNVGIRTFASGAALTITVRNSSGQTVKSLTKVYPANYFEQQGGTAFLGVTPGPSDSVAVTLDAGSAIIYGASTDNKTQDPAMQIARSVRP